MKKEKRERIYVCAEIQKEIKEKIYDYCEEKRLTIKGFIELAALEYLDKNHSPPQSQGG